MEAKEMRIAALSDSPTLNTSYGLQTEMWCDAIGRHHKVLMFPNQNIVGKPLIMGNYVMYPSRAEVFEELNDAKKIDVLYTHGDIQHTMRVRRKQNDFVWIGRIPIDTETYAPEWTEMLNKVDIVVNESKCTFNSFRKNGIKHNRHIYPCISDNFVYWNKGDGPVFPWRDPEDFYMLFVARPHWRKNLPYILVALHKLVHEERLPVKLFIHADFGDFQATRIDYSLLIHSLDLEDHIRMPKRFQYDTGIDEKILANLYDHCDVMVTPNLGEGLGVTIPEAMACETPVICTDYTSGPELIGDDRGKLIKLDVMADVDGFERPIPNMQSLIDAVKFYIDNPDEKIAHGENASDFARENFARPVVFTQWRMLLDEIKMNSVTFDENKLRKRVQ